MYSNCGLFFLGGHNRPCFSQKRDHVLKQSNALKIKKNYLSTFRTKCTGKYVMYELGDEGRQLWSACSDSVVDRQ